MRKYSHISVHVPEDILDLFLAKVSELAASRWRRDPAGEEAAGEFVKGMGVRYVYYARTSGPPAEAVFLYQGNQLRLINLFTGGDGVSHAEHGRITADLWEAGMRQACGALGLSGAHTASRTVKPEEGLPAEVTGALHRFSVGVNKSTGPSHPEDIQLWCQFLALLHATGSEMGEERLDAYLIAKKFPEDVVLQLLREHEMAMTLLPLYDQMRKAKAAVSVQ